MTGQQDQPQANQPVVPHGNGTRDENDVRAGTYNYLRLSMAAVIAALAIAMTHERIVAGCFQKSVSAYYYTPARAVFVGALVALCVGMVALLGRNSFEDAFLNLAGLFAPVVAFVPTKQTNRCSVVGIGGDGAEAPQPEQAGLAIANNMWTFFIVIAVGLAVAAFLPGGPLRTGKASYTRSYWFAVVVCLGGFIAFRWYDGFNNIAHLVSAILLFTCVIVVVFTGAYYRASSNQSDLRLRTKPQDGGHPGTEVASEPRPWTELKRGGRIIRVLADRYGWVGSAMVISVVVVGGIHLAVTSWDYWVLVIEALLIGLFGVFWLIQTFEHWKSLDPATPPPTPGDGATDRSAPLSASIAMAADADNESANEKAAQGTLPQ